MRMAPRASVRNPANEPEMGAHVLIRGEMGSACRVSDDCAASFMYHAKGGRRKQKAIHPTVPGDEGLCLEATHGAVGTTGSPEAALTASRGREGVIRGDSRVVEIVVKDDVHGEGGLARGRDLDSRGRSARCSAHLEG